MPITHSNSLHSRQLSQSSSLSTSSNPSTSTLPPPSSFYVQALYAYSGADTSSLSFRRGDLIEVLSTLESGWWDGVICQDRVRGWFPSNYVQRVTEEEAKWAREEMLSWYDQQQEEEEEGEQDSEREREEEENDRRRKSDESFEAGENNYILDKGSHHREGGRRLESSMEGQQQGRFNHEEQQEEEEDFWVPKASTSGQLFYYNSRTGETSRDMPINGQGDGIQIDHEDYPIDEEAEGAEEEEFLPEHNPIGGDWVAVKATGSDSYYYENTLTGIRTWSPPDSISVPDHNRHNHSPSTTSVLGSTVHPHSPISSLRPRSTNSDDSFIDNNQTNRLTKNLPPPPTAPSTSSTSPSSAITPSTQPSLPPFLSELERSITEALRNLVSEAGMGAMIRTTSDGEAERNFDVERISLAKLADTVVESIRNLLVCSGAMNDSTSTSTTTTDVEQFRPYTRQVTTNLSKLLIPIRALWATLETLPSDQLLDVLDDSYLLNLSPKERLSATLEAERIRQAWSLENDERVEREARLRSQLLLEAVGLEEAVEVFLEKLEKGLVAGVGGVEVDRSKLRSARCLMGSFSPSTLEMKEIRLVGRNWRGQGYTAVALPQQAQRSGSTSSPLSSSLSSSASRIPSKALTKSLAVSILEESKILSTQIDQLRLLVTTSSSPSFSDNSTSSVTTDFFTKASRVQQSIGVFLSSVEDVNIAQSVDVEVSPKVLVDVRYAKYRNSVEEAVKVLQKLGEGKQALYDGAHSLLFDVQDIFQNRSSIFDSGTSEQPTGKSNGAQPSVNSPLVGFSHFTDSPLSPHSILETLTELTTAATSIPTLFTAFVEIAEIQALVPTTLRFSSAAVIPVVAATITLDKPFSHQKSDSVSSQRSQLSSRSRMQDEEEAEDSSADGDSVDSDFFFPGGGGSATRSSPASVRTRASSKAAQFFGSPVAIPSWEKRRSSNATTTSSVNSDSYSSYRPRLMSINDSGQSNHSSPTKSPSSKSKLAKLLGSDAPEGQIGRSMSLSVNEPTPLWLLPDYGPDEVSFNMEGQVKGGTLRALVIAAASHEGRVDSNYLSAFLMTYRTFCTAQQLLDILIQRFLTQPPPGLDEQQMLSWETLKLRPIRARVANVIKSWVRDHMDHDPFDPDLLHKIADFAAVTMQDPVQSPQIIKAVEERLAGAAPRQNGNLAPGALPPSIVPRNTRKIKFVDIDPLELARQLTIMDGHLFSKITPQECLGKAWPKEYGTDAPRITAMIAMSNAVTRWVTETILAQEDMKKRANTIKHFILVAERCLALNNFSTLIHIIAGLNSTPVNRLRRTWETVSQKSMISLGILNNVMRQDKNYKEYREALRGVTPPCVPFLGVYLTDWTFIGDGSADMLREKPHQINFQKRQKATELILMIKLHQSTTYNLAAVPALVKWLNEQLYPANGSDPASDDQRLYEISLSREPRERDDEKIARLLSESGFL